MGKLFGTDGIRGIAGQTLTAELAFHVGQAVAAVLTEEEGQPSPHHHRQGHPHFLRYAGIGPDGRYLLRRRRRDASGHHPHPGGGFPDGAAAADAGIVISASHNPYAYNGIKVFNAQGYKLSDEMEGRVEDLILNHAGFQPAVDGTVGRRHHGMHALHSAYVRHLLGSIDCDLDRPAGAGGLRQRRRQRHRAGPVPCAPASRGLHPYGA